MHLVEMVFLCVRIFVWLDSCNRFIYLNSGGTFGMSMKVFLAFNWEVRVGVKFI